MHSTQRAAAWLLGLIWVFAGTACTSAHRVEAGESEPSVREACLNIRMVESFSPLHGMYVYARELGGQEYLLTLDTIYVDLPSATGITINGTFSRACSETGAALAFTDFGRRVSARVIRVEAVPSKEVAQNLVRERTAPNR